MILVNPEESTLDAIERIGRTYSTSALGFVGDDSNISFLYELIGALAAETVKLRKELADRRDHEITWEQARVIGIARCACGHPKSNHFEDGYGPCAHCPCKKLDEQITLPEPKKR